MRYEGLIENDLKSSNDISVSLVLKGCPEQLKQYYKQEFYNYEDGILVPDDIRGQIVKALSANNIERNFNIIGGEPFYQKNLDLVLSIVTAVRTAYPNIKITIQTKYLFEDLVFLTDEKIDNILKQINYLIDRDNEQIELDELIIL